MSGTSPLRLADEVAIVTGASRGIGEAVALRVLLALSLIQALALLPARHAHAQEDDWEDDDDWGEDEAYEPLDDGGGLAEDEFYAEVDEQEAREADETPAARDLSPEEVADRAWLRRFRVHNTWDGPVGGLRVVDAGSGPTDSFRVQLLTEFFSTSDFLVPGDEHDHVGGVLSLGWTVHEAVELFASLSSYSNSNPWERPYLFQTVGDPLVGTKVFFGVTPWLTLGADLSLLLTTGPAAGLDFDSFGGRLRANASMDLRGLDGPFPLVLRLNLAYVVDNSAQLVERVEAARYQDLEDPLPPQDETRHLVTAIERFGLGVNRTDFFEIGFGLEAPLRAATDFYLRPLAEWTLGAPVNRQGYECVFVPAEPGSDTPAPGEDSCVSVEGVASIPMRLTLGVRVLPPVKGLSTLLALDIGLTGTSHENAVRELAATAPWNLVLGLSYAFDTRPGPEAEIIMREVEREEEVREELPPSGRVLGLVVEEGSDEPVDGATVSYPGRELSAQMTAPDGRFASYALEPGPVELWIDHPDLEGAGCSTAIAGEGGDVELRCELPRPALVVVEESEVQILEQIQFAFDSAEILEASFGLMAAIARILVDNAQLTRIEIQGHTDDQGTAEYNQDLSQRRAESVRSWLVEHGVGEDRLTARGFGLTQPLAPNDSDENRARNRRVQFIIVEQTDGD